MLLTVAERLHEAQSYLDIPVKYTGDKTRCESNLFLFGLDAAKQRAIWQSAGQLNTECRLLRYGSSCPLPPLLRPRETKHSRVQSVNSSINWTNSICNPTEKPPWDPCKKNYKRKLGWKKKKQFNVTVKNQYRRWRIVVCRPCGVPDVNNSRYNCPDSNLANKKKPQNSRKQSCNHHVSYQTISRRPVRG